MRFLFSVAALLSLSGVALAQMPPPQSTARPFAPITLDQADYTQLQNFLADQPFKVANPLLQWLDQKEQAASRPAPTPAPPSPPPTPPEPPK